MPFNELFIQYWSPFEHFELDLNSQPVRNATRSAFHQRLTLIWLLWTLRLCVMTFHEHLIQCWFRFWTHSLCVTPFHQVFIKAWPRFWPFSTLSLWVIPFQGFLSKADLILTTVNSQVVRNAITSAFQSILTSLWPLWTLSSCVMTFYELFIRS